MINKVTIRLCEMLLYLLPFHYLLFVILLNDISILKVWKEVVLFLLGLIILINMVRSKSFTLHKDPLIILMLVFFLIAVFYLVISDIKSAALYHVRIYIEPFMAYVIFSKISLQKETFVKIMRNVFYIAIGLSIFGIFQALVLKSQFLVDIGYPAENGTLGHEFFLSGMGDFQRATSTFVYPNTFAFYLSMVLIMVFYNSKMFLGSKRKVTYFGVAVILLAIILTFSRSNWLGLAIILFFGLAFNKDLLKVITSKINKRNLGISFGIGLLVLLVLQFIGALKIITRYVYKTVTLKDTSVVGHLDSFKSSYKIFKENVFGTGLGMNGPKALMNFDKPYLTESSFFLMLFEVGIIGFIIYYLIYVTFGFSSLKNYFQINDEHLKSLYKSGVLLTLFVLIIFLFLPYIQDLETMIYYFALIGFINNQNLKGFMITSKK